ncbi:MAG: GNAT family N-acetyltransferase [Coprobacillus sp.]
MDDCQSIILETERLILRELQQDDFLDLSEILQDPEVVYAYEHAFNNKDVQEWIDRQRMRYKKYGFGLWAVVLKSTGEMIGQAGLTIQPYKQQEVLEIGYLLKKKFWHQGYAIEATMGCKQYAFYKLDEKKVYCIIKADNHSSIKVAMNLGMNIEAEFIARYYHGDMLHYLYSVKR